MSGSVEQDLGKIAQSKDSVAEQILKGGSETALKEVQSVPAPQQKAMIDSMTGRNEEVPKSFVGDKDVSLANPEKTPQSQPKETEDKVVSADIPVVSTVGTDTRISGHVKAQDNRETAEEKPQAKAELPPRDEGQEKAVARAPADTGSFTLPVEKSAKTDDTKDVQQAQAEPDPLKDLLAFVESSLTKSPTQTASDEMAAEKRGTA